MLSTGTGVNGFTLDPSLGEFILTHPDIKVPINIDSFSLPSVMNASALPVHRFRKSETSIQ